MSNAPTCSDCNLACELRSGSSVYPHRPDLAHKRFWVCTQCSARVGCHGDTTKPLGIPANAALRRARMILHDQRLDPLWKFANRELHGKPGRRRALVYKYLSHKLDIPRAETHTGMFTLDRCRAAWRALEGVTMADVEAHHQALAEATR